MPRGIVRDDGDPGNLHGNRIGLIEPDKPKDSLIPFVNGPKDFFDVNEVVDYIDGNKNEENSNYNGNKRNWLGWAINVQLPQ